MGRFIGIRHRRKKTSEGEARPTMVAIDKGRDVVFYELEDDTAELDFLMGRLPVAWRDIAEHEDISDFQLHHCKWRKFKKEEDIAKLDPLHLRKVLDKKGLPVVEVVTKVPIAFDGLNPGDKVGMVLGGSGDRFAAALSRRGEAIGAEVYRIPPFSLSDNRGSEDKENDHLTIVQLLETKLNLFYKVRLRDRGLIRVKESLASRQDAQKQRVACEQRIHQALVGKIFLNEDGCFPEGVIEDQFAEAKASDQILQALVLEEQRREKELARDVKSLDIWDKIFEGIKGVGPRLAAGVISPIGDIRRFWVLPDFSGADTPEEKHRRKQKALQKGAAKLKKFCGVHVMSDGRFPRRREGEVANWSPSARQALYLLADQFNRRHDSEWGKKLIQNKLRLREKHPEPVEYQVEVRTNGKKTMKTVKRYTDGHIHKMGQWRTLTRFVEWLFREWTRIENEKSE